MGSNMEFTNPEFLWLLLLIPVMAIWYFFVRKKDSADLHMPSIASFEHDTSREALGQIDPQLHTHNFLSSVKYNLIFY